MESDPRTSRLLLAPAVNYDSTTAGTPENSTGSSQNKLAAGLALVACCLLASVGYLVTDTSSSASLASVLTTIQAPTSQSMRSRTTRSPGTTTTRPLPTRPEVQAHPTKSAHAFRAVQVRGAMSEASSVEYRPSAPASNTKGSIQTFIGYGASFLALMVSVIAIATFSTKKFAGLHSNPMPPKFAAMATVSVDNGATNILIFGPNGSGKGTQGSAIKTQFDGMAHIESGAIFRDQIGRGTELGMKAKEYINKGDLVPDEITIPMILDTLKDKGGKGWLLDGFPRSIVQAQKLYEALKEANMKLDYVVEIQLPRETAKDRIMGRRVCEKDPNHPNNIYIDAIKPDGDVCRVCGGALSSRADDQDEAAINKRHDIYYNEKDGTLAAAYFYKDLASKADNSTVYMELDGSGSITEVKKKLTAAFDFLKANKKSKA